MKKAKIAGILICLIVIMMGACGKNMSNSDFTDKTETRSESTFSLNERQKEILSEQGLPTEYEQLSSTQQSAIVEIENMLNFVEEKYNTSFSYAGYVAQNSLEEEHMYAYPSSGERETDSFMVIKTDGEYKDDYMNIVAKEGFANYICDSVNNLILNAQVNAFVEITGTTLDSLPTDNSGFDGNVEGEMYIFIEKEPFDETEFVEAKENLISFLREHSLYGSVQLILLQDGNIQYLTKYNYTDYLSDEYYLKRDVFYINNEE